MTDARGPHMGGAVRDGRRTLPEWTFEMDARRRPSKALLQRLEREDIPEQKRRGYLVEIRVGHRVPKTGPGRPIPAVQAVYTDENAERFTFLAPEAKYDSGGIAGVGLVEGVNECIPAVAAVPTDIGGPLKPINGYSPADLRYQALEILSEAHDLDVDVEV